MNTTHNPIPQHFELAYHDHKKTRVCFFVNRRIEASCWSVLHHTPDLSTLQLHWGEEEKEMIAIHNTYNSIPSLEPSNSTLPALREALERWRHVEQLVVGDLNLHHPYWGGREMHRADPEAEEMLQIIEEYDLALLYKTGTATYQAWGSETND